MKIDISIKPEFTYKYLTVIYIPWNFKLCIR